MRPFWSLFTQDANKASLCGELRPARSILGFHLKTWPTRKSDAAVHLDLCDPFERIAVKTRRSRYEVIVLSGAASEVLVRGGRFFPEFRRATLCGSTAGGSAIRLKSIEEGLCMELRVDGTTITTSPVVELSRHAE